MKSLNLFAISLLFISRITHAAACCGGGGSNASLITNDSLTQVTTSLSQSNVKVDSVDNDGIWYIGNKHQQSNSIKIDAAHVFNDRWQFGASLSAIEREKNHERKSGLGDLNTTVGYEYLTDWDYHPWRPKAVAYVGLLTPLSKSKMESENGGLDSFGNGFWALSAGSIFSKTVMTFDLFSQFEIHHMLERKLNSSQVSGTAKPGLGGSLAIGGGYNLDKWRIGSSLQWNYEDPIKIEQTEKSQDFAGSIERYASLSLQVSYLWSEENSITVSYSDQTIVGEPVNTSLGQTVLLSIQQRWLR